MKTYEEWAKNPSWHGSYDDYCQHARAIKEYLKEEKKKLKKKETE